MVEAVKEELEGNYKNYPIIPFLICFFISKIEHSEIHFLKVITGDCVVLFNRNTASMML